ncbi:MAG: Mut7-C RNAse domain-containing protein [Deltaproteobacteria bacterium]|nr:Mut7-C RNAse domain-containing protein [Deltaproteobacteria bacterium]
MTIRFLCDQNIGKMAKWLRILGYDTLVKSDDKNQPIEGAERDGRIVLTRNRDFESCGSEIFVVIRADRVEDQIKEIIRRLDLHPDPKNRMSLCLLCNTMLENIAKEKVETAVPAHVYQNNHVFRRCPLCGRIYWPGTHARNIESFLKERIPKDLP